MSHRTAGPFVPDFPSLIRGLCEDDFAKREKAANVIYEHSASITRVAIEAWLADAELAILLLPGNDAPIHLTIGLAVRPSTFDSIRAASGSPRLANVPIEYYAREFELGFPGDVRLDVLSTSETPGQGAIAKYLEKHGEGIQQVEIDVFNVDRATELLRARFGLDPVYPVARKGADDTLVNFVLVPAGQNQRLLIELVERCGS